MFANFVAELITLLHLSDKTGNNYKSAQVINPLF